MAHRSGITDGDPAEDKALADMTKPVTQRRHDFARLITHRKHGGGFLFNLPGQVYKYMNENFILAGAMLERVTGKSWEDLMTTELFQPLGMTTAGFGAPGSSSNVDQPWGHTDASGVWVPSKGDNTPGLGPAGTVHASLADWAKFIRLHLTGSQGSLTLATPTFNTLHTQYLLPSNGLYQDRYGWGWIMYDDIGGVALGHDGSNNLWYCSCQVLPERGVAFIAVSNIGANTNGNGGLACGKVIDTLRQRYFDL
jgi:CubicO group peptidase (beta-lactamase class C family)